jgi:hypothetical protein
VINLLGCWAVMCVGGAQSETEKDESEDREQSKKELLTPATHSSK